ncbi:YdaU family protein [Bartonella sp. B10]
MKHANQQETPYYESSTLPYVCWYQNDFLGGVRGMRAHEIGIYTILLNEMYARGHPLKLSVERLARLCGCDKRTFVNALEMLIREGKILNLADGLWNKRCENVFHERKKLLEQKSFAGRSSAQKRKKINAQFQQLLNEKARDDEPNLKAQKEEEKETPNGVSEKKLVASCMEKEESVQAETFPHLSLPFTDTRQEATEHCSSPVGSAGDICAPVGSAEKICAPIGGMKNASPPVGKMSRQTTSPKGTRLPADWIADIDAAISEGLSEEQAHWQEKKFRDYWQAKSGKEALKADWQATWRNWFRREIERIKENQERLAILPSHSVTKQRYNNDDALYQSLINYRTN